MATDSERQTLEARVQAAGMDVSRFIFKRLMVPVPSAPPQWAEAFTASQERVERAVRMLHEIVRPAVEYASEGVEISAYQAYLLGVVRSIFGATEESLAIFGSRKRTGELIGEGERLVQSELADTLDTLSREGPALFYRGEIASALVRDMTVGGQIRIQDLADYRLLTREPLALTRQTCQVLFNPPPSSGGVLIAFGLALLDSAVLRRRSGADSTSPRCVFFAPSLGWTQHVLRWHPLRARQGVRLSGGR